MAQGGRDGDARSIGQLVASITEDISTLIRGEIELAKAEVRESAKQAGAGAGLVAGAGLLAFFAFIFLLIAAAYGLVAAGLPVWAGFLIVALILLLIAGILGAVAKRRFDRVKGPERAKAQKEATRRMLSSVPQRFKDATDKAANASAAPAPSTTVAAPRPPAPVAPVTVAAPTAAAPEPAPEPAPKAASSAEGSTAMSDDAASHDDGPATSAHPEVDNER